MVLPFGFGVNGGYLREDVSISINVCWTGAQAFSLSSR
jgi:hypothetical protein